MLLNLEKLTIQTFDDSKGDRSLAQIFKYDPGRINQMQAKGAGAYWCINTQEDPNKRGIENTSEFKRIGLDCDIAKEQSKTTESDLENLKTDLFNRLVGLEIPPSGIIKSHNGLHPYWEFSDTRQLTPEKRYEANIFYQKLLKSFTKITNISSEGDNLARVLRLPTSFHLKTKNNPYLITEIFPEGKITTLNEFIRVYGEKGQETTKNIDSSDFEQLAGRYGWDVFFGISESEQRSFKGIMRAGRDELLNAISLSVHNKILNEAKANSIIEWINSKAKDPLSYSVIQKFLSKKREMILTKEKSTYNAGSSVPKPKRIQNVIGQRLNEWEMEANAGKTGYPELDAIIKGFVPKRLYLLTGKTNDGKTTLACNFAYRLALQGKKVLYLALEPDTLVLDTLGSIATKTTYSQKSAQTLSKIPEGIDFYGGEIRSFTDLKTALSESQKYDLVVVDDIGYFALDERENDGYVIKQKELVQQIARYTKDFQNSILIIAHLNKDGSKKERPTMFDVQGSAAFSQAVTDILVMHRKVDEYDEYKLSDDFILVVAKTKAGSSGACKMFFYKNTGYIGTEREDLNSLIKTSSHEDISLRSDDSEDEYGESEIEPI